MTDQRELDRLLDSFFAKGTDELADRVIENALDEIDHTRQRHGLRLPRWIEAMPVLTRVAAAAVIGVVVVGGAFFVLRPGQPAMIGGPEPSATATAASTAPAPTATPVATSAPTPTPLAPLVGAIGDGRQIHTSTLLADGRVLVAGGYALGDLPLASATVYDPGTNTFSPTGSLITARGSHTATLLADGNVLITGGGAASWQSGERPYLSSAELYDPATGTFSPTGPMATAREEQTATLLRDGRVLVVGGYDLGSHALASAEIYDPKTGTFSPTGSMATARGFHTATLLADGRVLVVGGDPNNWQVAGPMLASAEIYDPKTGTFSPTGSLGEGRAWDTETLLSDGRVLVTGGSSETADLASAEVYDPTTGRFTPTGQMGVPRRYHTATRLADGRVLVAAGGGDYTNLNFLASTEIFDPKTGTFTATGPLAEARTYQAASLLRDGRVLVTGGYGALAPLASAELYDPTTGTFSPAGSGS